MLLTPGQQFRGEFLCRSSETKNQAVCGAEVVPEQNRGKKTNQLIWKLLFLLAIFLSY